MHLRNRQIIALVIILLIGLKLSAQNPAIIAEFDSLRRCAAIQIKTDKYYKSIKTIELLKQIAVNEGVEEQIALAENLFYLAYVQMHAYDKAEGHILEAIRINSTIKDTHNLSINYSNLTHFYMLSDDFPRYEKSLKKAQYLDQADSLKMRYYNYESQVMALYKQAEFDSLTIVSRKALTELKQSKEINIASILYTDPHWKETYKTRFQTTFEFYLAYGLMESRKDVELANELLNNVKDKNLEEILWFSPRVFKQQYRINHYKAQYFLDQKYPNLDSINHYQTIASFYFDKTVGFLEHKSGSNNNYLNEAIDSEMEIQRLELVGENQKQESTFIKRLSYLLAFLGLMSLAFVIYYRRFNGKIKVINSTLDEKNKILKQLHVHRNKFLAVLSHEIRTPMYALQELIANATDDYGEEESEEFSLANYSLINLRHSVDNSLQFSRLNFFKDSLSEINAPVNLMDLVTEIKTYYSPILIINEVELVTQIELQQNAFVLNRSKVAMVLHNLIKNAIELEDVMQVQFKIEETQISADKSKLKFSVTDDGKGISEEMLAYIKRGEIIITDENTNKGIKLGLILCNQILALYNSKLIFENTKNQNTVSFELELKPSHKFSKSPVKINKNKVRKKILYIDDNMINLLITKKIIESLNHDCYIESSGFSALKKIKDFEYDLILMDINMPDMDGFETTKAIHDYNANIPIIAYTALSEDEIIAKCQAVKISEVLTKPLDSGQFKLTIEKYFGQ